MLSEIKSAYECWFNELPLPLISTSYLDAYIENLELSPALREAYAHSSLYEAIIPIFYENELITGYMRFREPLYFSYGGGTVIDYSVLDELINNGCHDINNRIEKVQVYTYKNADPEVYSEEEIRSINAGAALSTWFCGHLIPDYERILALGLDGYAAYIEEYRRKHKGENDFYEALSVMLSAVQGFIVRYANTAKGELGAVLLHIAHHPPETFHQAIQLVWMIHILFGTDSFGRFDYYLNTFLERDIKAGRIDMVKAYMLVADMFMKIETAGAIQNMTIGGVDKSGTPFYTPLTKIVLEVTAELKYKGPNLCLRVTNDMPQEFWDRALTCIGTGIGLPALYNDSIYINALVRSGVPQETANGFCLAGCSQLMLPGECNFMNDIGMLNVAKIAELCMYGGYDPRTGTKVCSCPDAVSFDSFDELYKSFCQQLDYFVKLEVSIHEKELSYRASREGYVMRTLFVSDCIEKGLGVLSGGARYNHIELELIGITNAADHLYAIKKAVFDEGVCTMEELVGAMKSDFAGYDRLRSYLQNKIPKFGNGNEEVDALRSDIAKHLYSAFNSYPAPLGGVFGPGEVIFTAHDGCGSVTGALADGRRAGTVLADSAGACQGKDINGPTALLNSVLKLPVRDYLLTTAALNVKFSGEIFKESHKAVQSLFMSFFERGGQQLQINVTDAQMLLAAEENPEEYSSLVVRVGGYSDYFVRLSPELRRDIIMRTAQMV